MLTKKFQICLSCAILFLFYGALLTLPIYAQGAGQIATTTPRATEGNSTVPLTVGPIVYLSHSIDDNASGASCGDGDGQAESGELVELVVTVKNTGNENAVGVTGTLSTLDPDVTIFDWTYGWPDIPGGGNTGGSGTNFGFAVNPNLRYDKDVLFTMTVSASNGGPWPNQPFSVRIHVQSPPISGCPRVLTVASSNPNSGVNIALSPPDNNGRGSGTTQFTRTYNNNTTVTLTAPATASGNSFQRWQRNGSDFSTSQAVTMPMDAHYMMTAFFGGPPPYTVTTSPSGLQIVVDGNTYIAPQTFSWSSGSQHTISVTSPQSGAAGTRYLYSSWSDGGGQTHTIIAPSSGTTYTAYFLTQYFLTMNAGTGGTVSPASNWYNSGQNVTITATAFSGYVFSGWAGSGAGSYTGPNNPATITMNGPITETASFIPTPMTVTTSPSGLQIDVDGNTYIAPQTFSWSPGSQHTIGVTSPQSGTTGTRYVYNSWSDGGNQTHTITVPSSGTTYTAYFMTQYFLTMNAGTGGSVNPASNWYNSGQNVTITATANSGCTFNGWTGSYTGPNNPATITMNGPITETANFTCGCTIIWQTNFTVTDAGNNTATLSFGQGPTATDDIDVACGEADLPPVPPSGVFDARFELPVLPIKSSLKDYRNSSQQAVNWRVKFQPGASGAMNFAWNSGTFPAGCFLLKDEITGTLVNIDMKAQSSYALTNPGITSLKIELTPSCIVCRDVSVAAGWNIVSIPVLAADMTASTLFPDAASPAYEYDNGYKIATTLKRGVGYWIKFNTAKAYIICGAPVTPKRIPVVAGWNIIGPFETDVPVADIISIPPNIIVSAFFGYNNGYTQATILSIGKGYWVKASQAGELILPGSAMAKQTVETEAALMVQQNEVNATWPVLMIEDSEGNSSRIYLAPAAELNANFEMPPTPPSGIFDVRFSSGRYVESLESGQPEIQISSAHYPIRIQAQNLGDRVLVVKDALGGRVLHETLASGKDLVITKAIGKMTLASAQQLPSRYALSQNYPNPFNPMTMIRFALPEKSHVKLILYNVVGEKVAELVNQELPAGYHQVELNASRLASGVYFYEMKSGSFRDLKKMVIAK